MENNNIKEKIIEKCNKIVDEKLSNSVQYTSFCLLNDIFDIYETGTGETFDNTAFEAVTQKNVLEILEKGIIELFGEHADVDIYNDYDYDTYNASLRCYIYSASLRSSLQFLVDYAESHEDTRSVCDVKKRLQTILTHKNTNNITERLREFKKHLCKTDFLKIYEYMIDLTHIPLSHDWWERK